jgi:protein-L-isoaspartate(D-aspartate) O-methyltransferase
MRSFIDDNSDARRRYAVELGQIAALRSPAVIAAFATVPRERFLGPGPWRIRRPIGETGYMTTADANPRHIYCDALVALDEASGINNGKPSLWAFLFDKLDIQPGERIRHLGSGTGYYSAIAAELTGPTGTLTALELDPVLAARAKDALRPWPQVRVFNADGATGSFDPVDVIMASAGATHPLETWLDGLTVGGRLLFPMTPHDGPGAMLLVKRLGRETFAAGFLCEVYFIDFEGARSVEGSQRLAAAFQASGDSGASVRSLRRRPDLPDESSWLVGEGWWLSTAPPLSTST